MQCFHGRHKNNRWFWKRRRAKWTIINSQLLGVLRRAKDDFTCTTGTRTTISRLLQDETTYGRRGSWLELDVISDLSHLRQNTGSLRCPWALTDSMETTIHFLQTQRKQVVLYLATYYLYVQHYLYHSPE